MRAIVFGATGQTGRYLGEGCRRRGVEVVGVARSGACEVTGDVADAAFVESLVRAMRPQWIFHLAAHSSTQHAWCAENHATIATGALNVLEAVRLHQPACRVFLAGSGVQFVNRGEPLSERDPFEPSSAYAVARIEAVYWARYYRRLGLPVYVGYLFHHESPYRHPRQVCKGVAEAVKRIAAGSGERLRLQDIEVRKEVGFAGDIAEAVWVLVNQERVFEAAIGTGVAYAIREWLEACFSRMGLNWREHVEVGEPGFEPAYRMLVSEPSTIRGLGWSPKVGIEALAEMMLQ